MKLNPFEITDNLSKILTIALIYFFTLPVFTYAEEKPDTLSFIHITDTHICNLTGYHPFFVQRRQHLGQGVEPLVNFFKTVPKNLKSDFLVITGDMIDYYEAETASGNMLDTEIEQFIRHLGVSDVPVYMTLGNHDIASYRVNSETSIAHDQFNSQKARAAWIRNASCFRDGTYYSRTFQVDSSTFRLIFLDNAYYSPGIFSLPAEKRGEEIQHVIDKEQVHWLENQLKESDNDIVIIFMHMPLFNPNPGDIQSRRNNYVLNLEDTVAINHELQRSDIDPYLLNVLEKNSSTRLIMAGHRHSSIIHDVRFSDDYSLTHVMTGAFAIDSRNWRLIQLTSEKIIVSHPGTARTQYTISLY